jgi:predicted flavoprotein YhiN
VQVHVPSITGTSPTLDIVFQESATLGGTYRRIATVEQITTAGDYPIRVYNKQPFVRAVLTLGGSSSPAFGSVHVGLDDGAHRNDLQSGDNL